MQVSSSVQGTRTDTGAACTLLAIREAGGTWMIHSLDRGAVRLTEEQATRMATAILHLMPAQDPCRDAHGMAESCPGCGATTGVLRTTGTAPTIQTWSCTTCGLNWVISAVNPHLRPTHLADLAAAVKEIGRLRYPILWPTTACRCPGAAAGSPASCGFKSAARCWSTSTSAVTTAAPLTPPIPPGRLSVEALPPRALLPDRGLLGVDARLSTRLHLRPLKVTDPAP